MSAALASALPPATAREWARWYPLHDHPMQLALIKAVPSGKRFPVVPAGRRSGKTERFKRFLAREAMRTPVGLYFAAAPTYAQAKRIFWDDLRLLTFESTHPRRPKETELRLFLPNGSEIHLIGLDQPKRIEGTPWTGGGIDEIADVRPEALEANILPALNTVDPRHPDYRAWCWFLGVPDGLNHFYRMAELARRGDHPDYALFHWTSAEILPPDVIEAARASMSERQYRQEYLASFEFATGRIYEDYRAPENTTDATIGPDEPLLWTHDQNFTPLSSAIAVERRAGGDAAPALYVLDEIVLTSAIARQMAEEFVERYAVHRRRHVTLYGDPAGRAGEKHGHASDYVEIERVLKSAGWQVTRRLARKAPAIKSRQNAVRTMIRDATGTRRLFINPDTAPWCHEGLSTVQFQPGSAFQEDQRNQYQHITTAIGYLVAERYPQRGAPSAARPLRGL